MAVLAEVDPFDYEDLVRPSDDLAEFTEFCNSLQTQQRKPLRLQSFQRLCLCDYFRNTTVTVVIQSKKQGKTTLIAALCIFHVLTTVDANVAIVAVSKDQAKRLYEHICKFISKNPELRDALDIKSGTNEIRSRADRGVIKVLSADEETLEGIEPTLAVVDEFGQFKSAESWGPLNEGLDTRDGKLIVISNAGSDEEGPLGTLRAALQAEGIERHGTYRHSHTADYTSALHEWALDAGQDCENLEVVKTASPAPWTTLTVLARRRSTTILKARWLRMTCGLWVRGGEAVIAPWDWDALESPDGIPDGASCFVGLDVAFKGGDGPTPTDTTALVPHHWDAEGLRFFGTPVILSPPPGDARLDDRAIGWAMEVMAGIRSWDRAAFTRELSDDNTPEAIASWADAIGESGSYNVVAFIFDPNAGAAQLLQAFKRSHRQLTFVEFDQKPTNLVRADGRFMEAMRLKQFRHDGHEGFRAHVLNAVEKSSGNGFYFDHPTRPRKPQDALRAASMAHDAAVAQGGTGPAKKPRRVMRVYR